MKTDASNKLCYRQHADAVALAAVVLASILLSDCGSDAGVIKAQSVEKGTSLAELKATAGEPAVSRAVSGGDPMDLCAAHAETVKAVEYHAFDGLAKALRVVGGAPSYVVVVCLNSKDVVTATHSFHNN